MATYKKFSELPEITEANEYTKVPVLDGNEMKLLNGAKLGGDAGIKTAIIKDSNYDNNLAGLQTANTGSLTYTCTNMTFEEAYEIMASGEPLNVFGMLTGEGAMNMQGMLIFGGTAVGVPCIMVGFAFASMNIAQLYWTADGLSTSMPSSGNA